MSKTTENYLTVEIENRQRILEKWYRRLDEDYHENDPEGCPTCYEAFELGIIPEGEPEENI